MDRLPVAEIVMDLKQSYLDLQDHINWNYIHSLDGKPIADHRQKSLVMAMAHVRLALEQTEDAMSIRKETHD